MFYFLDGFCSFKVRTKPEFRDCEALACVRVRHSADDCCALHKPNLTYSRRENKQDTSNFLIYRIYLSYPILRHPVHGPNTNTKPECGDCESLACVGPKM